MSAEPSTKSSGISTWNKADIIGKITIPVLLFLFGFSQNCNSRKQLAQEKENGRKADSINQLIAKKQAILQTELQVLNIVWSDLNNDKYERTSTFIKNFLDDNKITDSSSVLRRALTARSRITASSANTDESERATAANVVASYEVAQTLNKAQNEVAPSAASKVPLRQINSVKEKLEKISQQSNLPVVYIQYPSKSCYDQIVQLRKAFANQYIVPQAEWIKDSPDKTMVKYFREEDHHLANNLVRMCNEAIPELKATAFYVLNKTAPRQLELWIGKNACEAEKVAAN